MKAALDHLVVAAQSLEEGVDYLQQRLGVRLPAGGKHPRMGTHNHLMRIGEALFLEVIAIDPNAQPPQRPRWFGLDDALVRARLAQGPRLHTWALNVPDLAVQKSIVENLYGNIEPMSRDALTWEITIAQDGQLPAAGLLPTLLQWHADPHPANAMEDLGCSLSSLIVRHNRPDWLRKELRRIEADHLVTIEAIHDAQSPALSACLDTPVGSVWLES
ncbi:VOC family protein [Aestuariirhabdus sp. Z084]|uniref:VOC family protein n=1 Tax=Aestuariirhabdus haliotis TaxID=2918751 RepID=UPI00201B35C7|nr:VOC family protein [Aestuariirhabdus haliotis]MCL6416519.1 VOC family protein [Aestuariirhabdus haliotis]MCL6420509.1 VOC family protein [Aestuariirhabdus haliotis]